MVMVRTHQTPLPTPLVVGHEAEPINGGRAAVSILLLPPSSLRPHALTPLDL